MKIPDRSFLLRDDPAYTIRELVQVVGRCSMKFYRYIAPIAVLIGVLSAAFFAIGAAWLAHPSRIASPKWNASDDQIVGTSQCERDKADPALRHVQFNLNDYASFITVSDDEFGNISFSWDGENSVREVKGMEIKAGNISVTRIAGRKVRDKVAIFDIGKVHILITAMMRKDYDVLDTVPIQDYERYLKTMPTIVSACLQK